MNPDPLQLAETGPPPSPKAPLRRWLLLYVLAGSVVFGILAALNLTTIVIALISVIVFAAGYYQGWKDAES